MIANKLTLNLSKSNLILLQPKSRGHRTNLSLISSPFVSNLPSVSMSKYLGLIFHNSLSFEPHINNLACKLSKAEGILSKVKVYLNTSTLCSLYYVLFHCHIQYGIITWSSTYKTYLKKLATLQNKAVKIVGNGTRNDRATSGGFRGGWGGCIPPHQPKPNDFGRRISLNFGKDLFFLFFFGDHLILGGKNV